MQDKANEEAPMSTIAVTDTSFSDSVLNSDKPVLVDFWAEWCGPCKAIAPALEEMAQSMGDKVTVAKINIDENPQTPQQYGVRGIPTLILFKDGQVAATKMGAMPKAQLQQWVDEAL
ncbi:thioredoxin TrxA [Nisaea acidiphila]|uniref:Thioredoxin n=1 Tax=Nisaea acidiphila TaxID=1862145 RepID=A0A9J7AUH0_9PROT|nr:thioredoxin TrxA [Nisaea acidiphila]UUX51379.1 thioredoxin TrxA [Nisaea acidiphila]